MSITIGGLSSGLPPNLVDQLIQAERMPLQNMEVRKEKQENQLRLVGELEEKLMGIQGTIGDLASPQGFNDLSLETGDPNIVSGTVDPSMAPKGSWNVEVMELAEKAAAMTNGFPDRDKTQIGTGYFKFKTPDGSKEVYINNSNNTLEGAAAAINSAGIGMRASVINDRSDPKRPFRLMISSEEVGGDNKVSYPTLYFLDGDQDIFFDKKTAAKNGRVKIDGFEFEIADNTVKDLIPGLSLDLRQAAPGRTINVTVKENQEVVTTKVSEFVKKMNEALSFLQAQSRVDGNTDTSWTLGGDSLVRTVENRLRALVQNPQLGTNSDIERLNQIGIEFNRNGTLELSEDRFSSALMRNPESVRQFFAGDGFNTGFVSSLRREVGNLTNSAFGQLAVRKRSIQDNITRIDQGIANKERQLERREGQLRRQFANLEQTMSRLQSQGNAVAGMASSFQGLNLAGATVR